MAQLGEKNILVISGPVALVVTMPVYRTSEGDFAILGPARQSRIYLDPVDPPEVWGGQKVHYRYRPMPVEGTHTTAGVTTGNQDQAPNRESSRKPTS